MRGERGKAESAGRLQKDCSKTGQFDAPGGREHSVSIIVPSRSTAMTDSKWIAAAISGSEPCLQRTKNISPGERWKKLPVLRTATTLRLQEYIWKWRRFIVVTSRVPMFPASPRSRPDNALENRGPIACTGRFLTSANYSPLASTWL